MRVECNRPQIAEEDVEEKTAYRDEGHDVAHTRHIEPEGPAVRAVRVKHLCHRRSTLRHDHMVEVNHVHKQQIAGHHDHVAIPPFEILSDEQEERRNKVSEHQHDTDVIPSRSIPEDEVASLLRDVGIPIEKILVEGDVGPEKV